MPAKKIVILRCYSKRIADQWVASCIDLCLAAQGDTFEEVKRKLESMITDYIEEAMTVDKNHAKQLLTRKAPLTQRLEYRWIVFRIFINKTFNKVKDMNFNVFEETVVAPNLV